MGCGGNKNAGCGCGCDGSATDPMRRKNQYDMLMALGLAGLYWIAPPKSVPAAVGFVVIGYGFKKCCDTDMFKPLYSAQTPWGI